MRMMTIGAVLGKTTVNIHSRAETLVRLFNLPTAYNDDEQRKKTKGYRGQHKHMCTGSVEFNNCKVKEANQGACHVHHDLVLGKAVALYQERAATRLLVQHSTQSQSATTSDAMYKLTHPLLCVTHDH